jgi:hypothetical protein
MMFEVSRSESLNSYLMFQPNGPNFLLSYILAWKNAKLNSNFFQTVYFSFVDAQDSMYSYV